MKCDLLCCCFINRNDILIDIFINVKDFINNLSIKNIPPCVIIIFVYNKNQKR